MRRRRNGSGRLVRSRVKRRHQGRGAGLSLGIIQIAKPPAASRLCFTICSRYMENAYSQKAQARRGIFSLFAIRGPIEPSAGPFQVSTMSTTATTTARSSSRAPFHPLRAVALTLAVLSWAGCANLAENQRLAKLCRPTSHPIAVLDNVVAPMAGQENPGGDDAACVASCRRGDQLSCVAHLRTACNQGDHAACIDYETKVGIL